MEKHIMDKDDKYLLTCGHAWKKRCFILNLLIYHGYKNTVGHNNIYQRLLWANSPEDFYYFLKENSHIVPINEILDDCLSKYTISEGIHNNPIWWLRTLEIVYHTTSGITVGHHNINRLYS